SRRLPGTRGSNEGTGIIPGVLDESTVVSATSSEGTGAKPGVLDEDKDITEDKYKIRVHKDEDEEMKDAKVKGFDKGGGEITDAVKEEAKKTSKEKDDTKKTELPLSSSSLSVSSGFGDHFLKLYSDSSLVSIVKDSADVDVSSFLDIPIQHETPQIQSPSVQKIPVLVISDTKNLPPIPEIVTETLAKLKGASSLTPAEQEATNIMQALKESKKTSRRLPGTRGSNEGTGIIPGVLDESTVVSTTSSEGTGAKPGVLDEDKDITEDKYKIRVHKDEDEEMKDAKVKGFDKGGGEITDAVKEEAKKTSKEKDDTKKTELPLSSSSLSVSSGFGDHFLKLYSDSSLVSIVKDSADVDVSSFLDIPIQHETPQIQSPSVQKIPVLVISDTKNLPPIPEIVTETLVTTTDPH
nr:hypothetical protein [Tanacetum cinerariifolium]